MTALNPKDLEQLQQKGISKQNAIHQLQAFAKGIPPVTLVKPAEISDGILRLSDREQTALYQHFETECSHLVLLKFVPASGAASRMFKTLFHFLKAYDPTRETLPAYLERTNDTALRKFINGITQLPFYHKVMERIEGETMQEDKIIYRFVQEMLKEDSLRYDFLPKALIPFHRYGSEAVTPFEEHLKEAAQYAKTNGKARLHFTISEQHETLFRSEAARVVSKISKATHTTFDITYSYQNSATDTIAVDLENQPLIDHRGAIVTRPAGHGALLENLNAQEADIIFIKNIDNVTVDHNLEVIATHKKILAGLLLQLQAKVFQYAKRIESGDRSKETAKAIRTFLESELNVCLPEDYLSMTLESQYATLSTLLNRPLRVCGMILAEGEPGGGPFWIKDGKGCTSLQIVESAQIDNTNPQQAAIARSAKYFNPVDLVCGIKNHKGESYNLFHFMDATQGFITHRTKNGRVLKTLERPGLWNGAMAFWNTVFVEVPQITFNPVKTVNDLLHSKHQA